MGLKAVIAMFLGLVIQLGQLQAGAAVIAQKSSCATQVVMTTCCKDACPCLKESDSREKPAPLAPAAPELKLLLSHVPDTSGVENLVLPPDDAPPRGPCGQAAIYPYSGVPLHVAFCSFVI